MSAVNDIFVQSEHGLLNSGHADIAVFVSGACVGRRFRARVDLAAVISFDPILGADSREGNTLRVLPSEFPGYLDTNQGDVLAIISFTTERGVRWKVVDRELNPVTVTVDFKLERQDEPILLVFNPNTGKYFLANENGVLITDGNGQNIVVQI